jgi:hypothetical protein
MKRLILSTACILWLFLTLFPCDYNIRDAGFVDLNDSPYRLYLFIDDAIPPEIIEAFKQESQRILNGSNIRPVVIDVSRV